VNLRGATAVLLAGTGSDDDYVYRAFAGPLHDAGARVVAPAPQPRRLIEGYREALDEAARSGPLVVGGISIGAVVSVQWALDRPDRAVAVLAGLPPWTGTPDDAPAALAARHTAALLRRDGLAAATAQMRAGSPEWLAVELTRSWAEQWPDLPEAMERAAGHRAPDAAELAGLAAPLAVAAATDDPVHPVEVALEWVAAAPRAALRTFTLAELGADPAVIGQACLAALAEL